MAGACERGILIDSGSIIKIITSMIDEKKIKKQLDTATNLFFIQPFLSLTDINNFKNSIFVISLVVMTTIFWLTAFGLKKKKEIARKAAVVVYSIQAIYSILIMIGLPSYLQQQLDSSTPIPLSIIAITEFVIGLFVVLYVVLAFFLSKKDMKEYFAVCANSTRTVNGA